jgi:hypothetical protein
MNRFPDEAHLVSNNAHTFLDPLWRRALLVAACAIWTVVELIYGDMFWVTLVGGMTIYGAWTYLYAYKPAGGGTEGPLSDK